MKARDYFEKNCNNIVPHIQKFLENLKPQKISEKEWMNFIVFFLLTLGNQFSYRRGEYKIKLGSTSE